jgi:hypothetical protein
MRTIPEENFTDNQMEMSFETLRGSDGEESASGMLARARHKRCVFGRGSSWSKS